ncbi:MAG: hypothetical protein U1F57_03525 [bacterium]
MGTTSRPTLTLSQQAIADAYQHVFGSHHREDLLRRADALAPLHVRTPHAAPRLRYTDDAPGASLASLRGGHGSGHRADSHATRPAGRGLTPARGTHSFAEPGLRMDYRFVHVGSGLSHHVELQPRISEVSHPRRPATAPVPPNPGRFPRTTEGRINFYVAQANYCLSRGDQRGAESAIDRAHRIASRHSGLSVETLLNLGETSVAVLQGRRSV